MIENLKEGMTRFLKRFRRADHRDLPSPMLADESRWYTEHTALLISTLKWALLGAAAGVCVGLGTHGFLWSLEASGNLVRMLTKRLFSPFWLLPDA
jgi:hypothetical protein